MSTDAVSMLASNKREGPMVRVVRTVVCNGCKYLETSMKMRSMRSTADYWNCNHPSVQTLQRRKQLDNSMAMVSVPKSIGEGSGSTPTPSWCPFNKGK